MRAPESVELRRLALAVSVLDDVDLVPVDDGVLLTGDVPVEVSWLDMRRAVAGADPDSALARTRVRSLLRGRRITAQTHPDILRAVARPVGLPVGHALHPGLNWVRHRVLGGVVDLGIGFVGLDADPDEVVVIPQTALDAAGVDPAPWWPGALDYLERMGAVAAERLTARPLLRPIGDCDVVTLVCSRTLRRALCARDGTGMRAAAVPMRRRGWLDLSRIDPAFTATAAAATGPEDRGFDRPLLLTADEVALAPAGGRPAELVLRDPAVTAAARPTRYR
jgi:hypothetical protein